MMRLFLSIIMSTVILSACALPAIFGEEDGEMIVDENIIESSYVNYRGIMVNDREMVTTIPLEVNSSASYEITRSSYISYYDGLTFLETELFTGGDFPKSVEMPEETTHVRVSFNEVNRESIQLNKVE